MGDFWSVSVQCVHFINNVRKFQRGHYNRVSQLQVTCHCATIPEATLLLPVCAWGTRGYHQTAFWNPLAHWLLELRNPDSLRRGPHSIKHTPAGALLLIQGHREHALNLPLQERSVLDVETAASEGQAATVTMARLEGRGWPELLVFHSFII